VYHALLFIAVGSSVANPSDLRFLYEGHIDFSALPTFLVVQGVSAVMETSVIEGVFGNRVMNPGKVSEIMFQQLGGVIG
jgi:hypothetical protein